MNPLWLRQIAAVTRLELVKNLFALRAAPLYLLAAMPVFVVALILFVSIVFGDSPDELETMGGTAMFFAHLYQFILRFVVYAGCVWIFMNLFRGEVLDRSLHYYFLAPIRREVLVVGKFVSGWLSAVLLFVGSTVITMFLLYSSAGPIRGAQHLLAGPGSVAHQQIDHSAGTPFAGVVEGRLQRFRERVYAGAGVQQTRDGLGAPVPRGLV